MYSVVLMAALTSGQGAPDFHGFGYPRHYGACYGIGYQGWHGCGGCWGMPYCGYGPAVGHGHGPDWPGYACYGGCGGYASMGYGLKLPTLDQPPGVPIPGMVAPEATTPRPKDEDNKDSKDPESPKMKEKDKDKGPGKIDDKDLDPADSRAKLIINLPQGAKLYVDDSVVKNASESKVFRTPRLEKGEQYYYELRAEIVRDGKTLTKKKRVTLGAGDTIRADFSELGRDTGVASAEE